MTWTPLPTNYVNSVWSGRKRYRRVVNSDNTVSFLDLTDYYIKEMQFMEATEINRVCESLNEIMTDEGRIKPLLSVAVESGAIITVINGETERTFVSVGDTTSVPVPTYGTYTVSATKNNTTSEIVTVIVDTMKKYPITLNF